MGWRTQRGRASDLILITSAQVPTFLTWPIAASFMLRGIVVAALLLAMGPVVARARRLAVAVEAGGHRSRHPHRGRRRADGRGPRVRDGAPGDLRGTPRGGAARGEPARLRGEHGPRPALATVLQARLARLAQQAPGEDADAAIQEAQYGRAWSAT